MTKSRLLHAMLRVANLERSLAFYREFFDLQELRRIELVAPTRTLVFIAPTDANAGDMQLELWHEPECRPVNAVQPNAGHVGIGVSDIVTCVEQLRAKGVPILQEPAALRPGGRIIAIITDPDGHEIELLS